MKLLLPLISLTSLGAAHFAGHPLAPNPGIEHVRREVENNLYRPSDGWYGQNDTNCTYASVARIEQVWDNLYNNSWGSFFKNFHDEIDWTVMYTQPLSGHYTNISQFVTNGVIRLLRCFDGPANFTLINVVGGCNNPWSVQETLVGGVALNGRIIDEVVVWATRWDESGRIAQVRSYVDSYITTMVIFENEVWTNSSWRDNKPFYQPGPLGMPNLTQYLGYDPNTDLPP